MKISIQYNRIYVMQWKQYQQEILYQWTFTLGKQNDHRWKTKAEPLASSKTKAGQTKTSYKGGSDKNQSRN